MIYPRNTHYHSGVYMGLIIKGSPSQGATGQPNHFPKKSSSENPQKPRTTGRSRSLLPSGAARIVATTRSFCAWMTGNNHLGCIKSCKWKKLHETTNKPQLVILAINSSYTFVLVIEFIIPIYKWSYNTPPFCVPGNGKSGSFEVTNKVMNFMTDPWDWYIGRSMNGEYLW